MVGPDFQPRLLAGVDPPAPGLLAVDRDGLDGTVRHGHQLGHGPVVESLHSRMRRDGQAHR